MATIRQVAEALAESGASAVVAETCDRLATEGVALRAVAEILSDRATKLAAATEARQASSSNPLALEAIPFGVKDLIDVDGAPTRMGTPGFAERPPAGDATIIERLVNAGAIPIAKLATTPLAGIGLRDGVPEAAGATKHPWDTARWVGGSSGGSVASVSAGLLPFALGSETGGSLVNPSAWGGVTGIRPTYGSVPTDGCNPLSPTLDKFGVIATTAADCEKIFTIIADDPGTDGGKPLDELRIGFQEHEEEDWYEHTRAALKTGRDELSALVGSMVPVDLPASDESIAAMVNVASFEAAQSLTEQLDNPDFVFASDTQRENLSNARKIQPSELKTHYDAIERTVEQWRAIFEKVDLVVAAASAATASLLGDPRPDERCSGQVLRSVNIGGLPGLALPCGVAKDGMPVGLHLIGPKRSEPLIFRLAKAFQSVTSHHLNSPISSQ